LNFPIEFFGFFTILNYNSLIQTGGKMNSKGFITGILLGGLAGGLAALLYTPYSGRKMRRVLNRKKDDIMDEVKDYVETAEEAIRDSKKKVETILNDARKMVAL